MPVSMQFLNICIPIGIGAGFKIQDMDRNMVVHMSRGGLINTDKLVQKMGNVDVWNILTGQKIPALVNGQKIKDGNTTTSTTNDSDHEYDLEPRVIAYDKLCTGISHENRSRLLSKCFRESETLSYAAINKFDKQVKIRKWSLNLLNFELI